MYKLGVIGRSISYSFSKKYFAQKFRKKNIENIDYEVYDLDKIERVTSLLKLKNLIGLNVTTPYKEEILNYLDKLSPTCQHIGAANTLVRQKEGWVGYNTDILGFERSLVRFSKGEKIYNALILGSGGATKAVAFVLKKLGISYRIVSRNPTKNNFAYQELGAVIQDYTLLINGTPLGVKGKENSYPDIPYNKLNKSHMLFDLVYNPPETIFLKNGLSKGARIKNGWEMLQIQADESWKIWKEKSILLSK